MNRITTSVLFGTLIAGGITLLGATVANAAETDGTDGIASGTQIVADITAPITALGNAVTLIGNPISVAPTPATAAGPAAAPAAVPVTSTSGANGVASGTQIVPVVSVPISVRGNSITLIGDPTGSGSAAAAPTASPAAGSSPSTSGTDGVVSGTQVAPLIQLPVTVGGNAITVIGDPVSSGSSGATPVAGNGAGSATTDGSNGLLGGTQVVAGVLAPVGVTGNAITLIGDPASTGSSATPAPAGVSPTSTDGTDGIVSGSQVIADLGAPVTVSGNSITLIGDPTAVDAGTTPAEVTPATPSVVTPAVVTTAAALSATIIATLASTGVDPVTSGLIGLMVAMGGLLMTLIARRLATRV